eukprot:TRINITY_DN659_c0_g2_i1.p2 TRINITY_DN659_c0_g2~~TRINITY_DN659_c0_g2_i1.p2  ORF type:complete len:192 (+),score=48.78 TRINITY_DN659_c0_g2_i1:87-578(+)
MQPIGTDFVPRDPATGRLGKGICLVEIVLSILLLVAAIIWLAELELSDLFERVILALSLMLFSFMMCGHAAGIGFMTKGQQYYLFYQTWIGRGLWLVFIGCLVLIGKSHAYILFTAIVLLIYAILAVVAHFVVPWGPPAGLSAGDRPSRPLAEEPPQQPVTGV